MVEPVVLWTLSDFKISSRFASLWSAYEKGKDDLESCTVRVYSDRGTVDMDIPLCMTAAAEVFQK